MEIEVEGINKDNKCTKCGTDLNKEGSVKVLAFLDGKEISQQQYECLKCGNKITITMKGKEFGI